jgi:tRNA A-37 threonylcarbamoyl transferase component Bud32
MEAGQKVAARFRIEREAGRGANGVVYRAFDEALGIPVALKILSLDPERHSDLDPSLLREAELLAELAHPNIVRLIATGTLSDEGAPFIAMEWLEGENLASRQSRAPVSLAEALNVAAQICTALGALHEMGIVHRDVKPANVFLTHDDSQNGEGFVVKLVDFGVAMMPELGEQHEVAGTPAYMSPEQVRGERGIDARADLYAVGAVLFELIAGRPPHVGVTRVATLARMVTTRAPRLTELKRNVPWPIDELVAQLLALSPDERPKSATEVAETLRGLAARLDELTEGDPSDAGRSSRLGSSSSRLVSSVVGLHLGDTAKRDAAIAHLKQQGADAVPLGPDAVVAQLGARRAQGSEARTALDLARHLAASGSQVGVASGRVRLQAHQHGDTQPVGEVVDRASSLARDAARGSVLADATTSELCRGRYEFKARDDGSAIVGEPVRGARGAGGAPFVGREAELAQILSSYDRAERDRATLVVTITGPPGIGKSRLRREALTRIAARETAPLIVLQRSESYGRRHALGAAADILRSVLLLPKAVTLPEAQRALELCFGEAYSEAPHRMLARLLANEELPSGDQARGTRDLLWLAMTDLVVRIGRSQPIALVLEDMQWADPESVAFVDHLLGQNSGLSLIVIATLRPDFWTEHQSRFEGRDHVRLELGPISQRSTRALAAALVGDQVSEETLEAIIQKSGGLPLFAEELARLAASGRSTASAPTIQAAIQVSLDALDEDARDAIGRLSVFGVTGWDKGLEALELPCAEAALRALAAAEILVEQETTRFAGVREWTFKHALVRDVAYHELGEEERAHLHILAARWLAAVGEDATVVADHFDLGGEQATAATYWARAAQRALSANALSDALTMADRALAFAEDKKVGFQRASLLDDVWSRLDPRASDRESALWALEENVHDDATAIRAQGARARYDDARGVGQGISDRLATVRDEAAALGLYDEEARCSAALAARLAFAGQLVAAEAEAARLLKLSQSGDLLPAAVDAWQTLAITRQTNGALSAALDARRNAAAAAHSAGLREREAILTTNLGFALTTIGARQEARALLEQGLSLSEAIGSAGAARHARMILLGWTATFGNDRRLDAPLGPMRADADNAATGVWTAPDRENLGTLYYRGSELLLFGPQNSLERARKLLCVAAEAYRSTHNRDVLPVALGMWALGELRAGAVEKALALAQEAGDLIENGAPSLLNESTVYVALHDTYSKLERGLEAREAVARGMVPLLRRIHGLRGTSYARLFLTELTHNAALVRRAEAYGLLPDAISVVLEQGVS